MSSMPRLMPALVTPFDRAGAVALDHHRHNLATLWDHLEPGERETLIAEARATLGKGAVLVCGIAAETVRQAAAMVTEAAAGGADAVPVITRPRCRNPEFKRCRSGRRRQKPKGDAEASPFE